MKMEMWYGKPLEGCTHSQLIDCIQFLADDGLKSITWKHHTRDNGLKESEKHSLTPKEVIEVIRTNTIDEVLELIPEEDPDKEAEQYTDEVNKLFEKSIWENVLRAKYDWEIIAKACVIYSNNLRKRIEDLKHDK